MEESRQTQHTFEFGPFRIDSKERLLLRDGRPVQLAPKAFETLLALVRQSGHVVEKDELMEAIWPDNFVEEIGLTRNVSVIRKALGDDPAAPRYIETVPKLGYRFIAEVREAPGKGARATGAQEAPASGGYQEPGGGPPVEEITQSLGQGVDRRRVTRHARFPVLIVFGVLLMGFAAALTYRQFTVERDKAAAGQMYSIAVLPFKVVGGAEPDEALGVGMADALITKLGGLRRLTVRPTRAVLKYSGQPLSPQTAGRELGVEAVLDGTVQRSGSRVRVTVQLVRVRDGRQLWSGTFNEPWSDVFVVQDAISNVVAHSLTTHVTREERDLLARRYTENAEAYEAYQRGRYFWNKRTPEGFRKAIVYFREATDHDPNYALAYTGLADSYILLAVFGDMPPGDTTPKAKAAALRALDLDGTLAEAHTSLAAISWWYEHDLAGAEREFKRAIELNPNYPTARHWYALYLSEQRRPEEALREIRLAQQLDPLSTVISSDVALIFHEAGRYDEAIEQYRMTLELDPGDLLARRQLGNVYVGKGMYGEAIAEYQKAIELHGEDPINLVALGAAYARSGQRGQALKVVDRLKALSGQRYVPPFYIASIYFSLGDRGEAFKWIEMVFRERGRYVDYMRKDFKGLQSDPRWVALERRYGSG